MSMVSLFRIVFWYIFGGMIAMQAYFASQVRLAGGHMAADRKAIEREGWRYAVVRAIRSISLIALLVFSIVDLALRIPKEEQMMIEEFGDEYKAYMQRTGRLLPKK